MPLDLVTKTITQSSAVEADEVDVVGVSIIKRPQSQEGGTAVVSLSLEAVRVLEPALAGSPGDPNAVPPIPAIAPRPRLESRVAIKPIEILGERALEIYALVREAAYRAVLADSRIPADAVVTTPAGDGGR